MSANQSFGDYRETREDTMAAYDALPPRLREVIARAPFSCACGPCLREWRELRAEGVGVETCRRDLIESMATHLMQEARKAYGADHPDAQRSRLAPRAGRCEEAAA